MRMTSPERTALDAWRTIHGDEAALVARAPGRVELLGNHTDYNGGLVVAAAVDRETFVVGCASADGRPARIHVRSTNFAAADEFAAFESAAGPVVIPRGEPGAWPRYVRGVAWALQEAYGRMSGGAELVVSGDVPLGAGLSSSASLQAAVAMFLLGARLIPGHDADLDDAERMGLAQTLRRSENAFVGVNSGLLDQFSSLFGRADCALFLDCRTLEYERVPLGEPAPAIVICDTKTSRRLADGKYNERFAECRAVVEKMRSLTGRPEIELLRDVSLDELREHWDRLDPTARLRARHVLTENERVRRGIAALRRGDVARFGELISESHASSRADFANSSPALDAMIESAAEAPGFYGGKLSGAGWAGCTVNLVDATKTDAFAEAVLTGYGRRTGIVPDIHVCRAAEGASVRTL